MVGGGGKSGSSRSVYLEASHKSGSQCRNATDDDDDEICTGVFQGQQGNDQGAWRQSPKLKHQINAYYEQMITDRTIKQFINLNQFIYLVHPCIGEE